MAKYTVEDGAVFLEKILEHAKHPSGFNSHNHIIPLEVGRGYARAHVELAPRGKNPYAVAHGGLIFALGDVTAGLAATSTGKKMLTQCANINFLKATSEGKLTDIGREIRAGKTTGLYDVEIFNDKNEIVAKGSFTVFFLGDLVIDDSLFQ